MFPAQLLERAAKVLDAAAKKGVRIAAAETVTELGIRSEPP